MHERRESMSVPGGGANGVRHRTRRLITQDFRWRCAQGKHPYPSRTRWLSSGRPMILYWRRYGKAGGCRIKKEEKKIEIEVSADVSMEGKPQVLVCQAFSLSSRGFAAYASTRISAYVCKHPPQKTMCLRTYSLTGAYSSAG